MPAFRLKNRNEWENKEVCWKQSYQGEKGRVNLEKLWLSRKDEVSTPAMCNYKVEISSTAVGYIRGMRKKVNQKNSFNPTALRRAWETYRIRFCPSQNSKQDCCKTDHGDQSESVSVETTRGFRNRGCPYLSLFRIQGQFYEAEILLIQDGTAFYGRIYYMTTLMLHTWL